MMWNDKKLKLPWTSELIDDHFVIRNSNGSLITLIPPHAKNQESIANFIITSSHNKTIKENMVNKLENIAMVFGMAILLLVLVSILVDIAYAPMLILGGGILITTSYIYSTRTRS